MEWTTGFDRLSDSRQLSEAETSLIYCHLRLKQLMTSQRLS